MQVAPQFAVAEEGRVARMVGSQLPAHRRDVGATQGDRGGGRGHGKTWAGGIQTPRFYLSKVRCTTSQHVQQSSNNLHTPNEDSSKLTDPW